MAAFVLLTAPLLAIGLVALRRSGLSLSGMRREIEATLTRRPGDGSI